MGRLQAHRGIEGLGNARAPPGRSAGLERALRGTGYTWEICVRAPGEGALGFCTPLGWGGRLERPARMLPELGSRSRRWRSAPEVKR